MSTEREYVVLRISVPSWVVVGHASLLRLQDALDVRDELNGRDGLVYEVARVQIVERERDDLDELQSHLIALADDFDRDMASIDANEQAADAALRSIDPSAASRRVRYHARDCAFHLDDMRPCTCSMGDKPR